MGRRSPHTDRLQEQRCLTTSALMTAAKPTSQSKPHSPATATSTTTTGIPCTCTDQTGYRNEVMACQPKADHGGDDDATLVGDPVVKRNSTMQARMREYVRRRGGNCHICGQPVDYTIPYYLPGTRSPNPEAYVVDHLIPLHKGGAHDTSNGVPAHWRCNSKKRARLYAPIIKRSGALE